MALSISSLQRGVPAKFPEVPVGEVPFGGNASWGKGLWGEVPVGGTTSRGKASRGKCQLGEMPGGGSASWETGSKNLTLGQTIFFQFCTR